MMEKSLGKISHVSFGSGGYDDAMFGLSLSFTGDGWGVNDFIGWWSDPPSSGARWTKEEQEQKFLEATLKLKKTLEEAKKHTIQELVGVPVEVTFKDMRIASWRVLSEVI